MLPFWVENPGNFWHKKNNLSPKIGKLCVPQFAELVGFLISVSSYEINLYPPPTYRKFPSLLPNA